jgi:hopanoid biosynthesis associated protein HpnK
MVGASASADAVARARRMPQLRVGLHLTLVEDVPVLPPDEIPDLIERAGPFAGRLRRDLASFGVSIVAKPSVRRQLRAEIRAQFDAYQATGLALDHVNAHRHYHLHPTVLSEILSIGAEYGMRALRVPIEDSSVLRRLEPMPWGAIAPLEAPWAAMMLWRVRRAGMVAADRVFGLSWSGGMSEERIAGLITNLPLGCTEIYTHPATLGAYDGAVRNYAYADELAALLSQRCREAIKESGAAVGGYGDLIGEVRGAGM